MGSLFFFFGFSRRERDLLKDEASQLSTELSAAKMDLSDVDRQLQEVQEQKARLQREAVEQVEMLRVNLQTSERELTRTKEVSDQMSIKACHIVPLLFQPEKERERRKDPHLLLYMIYGP